MIFFFIIIIQKHRGPLQKKNAYNYKKTVHKSVVLDRKGILVLLKICWTFGYPLSDRYLKG